MGMNKNAWLGIGLVLALCPAAVVAQQASQGSSAQASQQTTTSADKKAKPAAAKAPRVWTEDDIASVRTPADDYMDVQRTQEQEAAEAAAEAAKQKHTAANAPKAPAPPLLSNPKSAEDADKMIAWEQRDIDSQQKYLDQLQRQIESAPPDQQAHLQSWIDQEVKTIADTKKEQAGLEAQKADLEKKAAAAKAAAGQQPPQSQQQ